MSLADWTAHLGAVWLIGAAVLGIGELVVPGVFLIFLGIAAAITGIATLALPDLAPPAQLASFAIWSVVAVVIGQRWYRDYPVETTDPLLNDRSARLVGMVVTVERTIRDDDGRVTVGDGSWPAHGPDAAIGEQVRIVGVDGGVLQVEPLTPPLGAG